MLYKTPRSPSQTRPPMPIVSKSLTLGCRITFQWCTWRLRLLMIWPSLPLWTRSLILSQPTWSRSDSVIYKIQINARWLSLPTLGFHAGKFPVTHTLVLHLLISDQFSVLYKVIAGWNGGPFLSLLCSHSWCHTPCCVVISLYVGVMLPARSAACWGPGPCPGLLESCTLCSVNGLLQNHWLGPVAREIWGEGSCHADLLSQAREPKGKKPRL